MTKPQPNGIATATGDGEDGIDDPEASTAGRTAKTTSVAERVGIDTAPLIFIGVGGSLAVVGSVPLVVTLSLGVNSSATIIGVGFVGFGFLIIVPGLCWCLVSSALAQCERRGLAMPGRGKAARRRHRRACRSLSTEQEVELLVLSDAATIGTYSDATAPTTTTTAPSCGGAKTKRGSKHDVVCVTDIRTVDERSATENTAASVTTKSETAAAKSMVTTATINVACDKR